MSNDSAGEETTDPTPTRPLDIVQPESTTAATLGEAEPFTESWTQAIKVLDEELIGGPRLLTPRDVAKQLGVSVVSARKIWRAMGFPNIQATEKVFTTQDVAAMATIVELVREDVLNEETAISIARSIGQMTDRMVVWQIEALVEDKMNSESLSDPEARREVVRLLPSVIESLEDVVTYSYRRQLNSALQRLTVRVEAGLAASEEGRDGTEDDTPLPLARAVGFADMVSCCPVTHQVSEPGPNGATLNKLCRNHRGGWRPSGQNCGR